MSYGWLPCRERIYHRAKPGNILLQEVSLEVESPAQCDNQGPGLLCASHQPGGREPCQGDSGGGLLHQAEDSQTWLQLGVLSGCARRDRPGEEGLTIVCFEVK